MPALYDFFVKHVTLTPYSVHYQKCGNKKCIHPGCFTFRSNEEERELVLQLQPAPQSDPSRPGHYLPHDRAIEVAKENPKLHAENLNSLPSKQIDPESRDSKKKIDQENAKKVHSWKITCVCETVQCYNCDLQRIKEDNQYICGHLLLDSQPDDDDLKEKVVQHVNLCCSDPVEKEYYNPVNNGTTTSGQRLAFHTRTICAICTSGDSVLQPDQVEKEVDCEGKKCLPMCEHCIEEGIPPVTYVRANQSKKRKTLIEKKSPKSKKEKQQKGKRQSASK